MDKQVKMKRIDCYIEPALHKQAKGQAKNEAASFSYIVRKALRFYLQSIKGKELKIN